MKRSLHFALHFALCASITAIGIAALATTAPAQALIGVTTDNTVIIAPNISSPEAATPVPFTLSLPNDMEIVGLDVRPATFDVYLLGYHRQTSQAQLFTLNRSTGTIQAVGLPVTMGFSSGTIGFDFNPVVDRIRVIGSNGKNYRINPNTGEIAATDTDLAFAVGDMNAGSNPAISAVAYTNSVAGTSTTFLYGYDAVKNILVSINPPNGGIVNTIGSSGIIVNTEALSIDMDVYVDMNTGANSIYLAANAVNEAGDHLYKLDPTTGTATDIGPIGFPAYNLKLMSIIPTINTEIQGNLLYVLGQGGSSIGTIDSKFPSVLRSLRTITGLDTNQTIIGIDVRHSTSELWGIAYNHATKLAQLYTIDPTSGAAIDGGRPQFTIDLDSSLVGFDFNPVVDRIRLVTESGTNLRLNPVTGDIAATDSPLNYAVGDPRAGATPKVSGVAYTNNYLGTATTVLYGYDATANTFVIQNPPNAGVLNTVGASGITINRAKPNIGFDIVYNRVRRENIAFMQATPGSDSTANLYEVNLATGSTTSLGRIGSLGFAAMDIAGFIDNSYQDTIQGQLIVGLTQSGSLITFDSEDPSIVRSIVGVSGLMNDERLVGMDFRASDRKLYGIGYDSVTASSHIYVINYNTGEAVRTSNTPTAVDLGRGHIGFDFNAVDDMVRVTSSTGVNVRINPNTGDIIATDGRLTYVQGDINTGATPNIGAIAYTNSYFGATSSTLLALDDSLGVISEIMPPKDGMLYSLATLPILLNKDDRTSDIDVYYDSANGSNTFYLSASVQGSLFDHLYTFNPDSGTTVDKGTIGFGVPLVDLAVRIEYAGNPTSVNGLETASHLTPRPNPVQTVTQLFLPEMTPLYGTIKVLSGTGLELITLEIPAGSEVLTLDLSGLPAGYYTAIVSHSNTITYTAKIIKL